MSIEIDLMANGAPAQGVDKLVASRAGSPVSLTPDDIGERVLPHSAYHFSGFAGDQTNQDGKFFDRSGQGNHASPGANLSDANMFSSPGNYVSTVDPTGGATDSVIRLPNLNFDYAGGEKLLLFWMGIVTPEGADVGFLGDGYGTGYPGLRIRAKSTGKWDFSLSDGSSAPFSGTSAVTVFDSMLHSLGLVLDGENKKYAMWSGGSGDIDVEAAFGSGYSTFASGATVDTTNAQTFNIGTTLPAVAASTIGIVSHTRALHILRLPSTQAVPSIATMTALFQQLRANPGASVLGRAI